MGSNVGEIVRIGKAVHRPLSPNYEFAHSVLEYLQSVNFPLSPEFLGLDKSGREMLGFIDGYVPPSEIRREANTWTNESLTNVFQGIRAIHDLCANSELRGDKETVIHGDLTPRNTVYDNGNVVAFIDWDLARPGDRLEDIGNALWRFLALGAPVHDDPETQGRLIRFCCNAYQLEDRSQVLQSIMNAQNATIVIAESHTSKKTQPRSRLVQFDVIRNAQRDLRWTETHTEQLAQVLL